MFGIMFFPCVLTKATVHLVYLCTTHAFNPVCPLSFVTVWGLLHRSAKISPVRLISIFIFLHLQVGLVTVSLHHIVQVARRPDFCTPERTPVPLFQHEPPKLDEPTNPDEIPGTRGWDITLAAAHAH